MAITHTAGMRPEKCQIHPEKWQIHKERRCEGHWNRPRGRIAISVEAAFDLGCLINSPLEMFDLNQSSESTLFPHPQGMRAVFFSLPGLYLVS